MMMKSLLLTFVLLQAGAAKDWETTRGIAEAEFEILMMMIDQGAWEKIPAKARSLFSLRFPPEQEHLKVSAAREYVDKLLHASRPDLAHVLLDAAIEGVTQPKLQGDLYREKGFVCRKEGREDCAAECFEKSVELENRPD